MNDFAWRRQLRALDQPHAPRRDLWPDIERALDAAPVAGTHHARGAWLFAASLAAVTVLALGLAGRGQHGTTGDPAATAQVASWKPDDPRLAGAAIELTAAQLELLQAMQQDPGSLALQRLFQRTQQQQSRLRQLGRDAG